MLDLAIFGLKIYMLFAWFALRRAIERHPQPDPAVKGMVDFFGLNLTTLIAMTMAIFIWPVAIVERMRSK